MLKKTKNIFLVFLTAVGGLLSAAGLGLMGGAHTVFAAEDNITHAVCGKSDCGHAGHGDITYSPWTDATKLPSHGNYYLTCDYENVAMAVRESEYNTDADDELNLDLNGHTVKINSTSPAVEVYTVLNLCDSSVQQTGRIISASTVTGASSVRVSEGTHENYTGDIVCSGEPTYVETQDDGRQLLGYRVLTADGSIPDGAATYMSQQAISGGVNNGTYVLDTARNVYRISVKTTVYGELNFYGGKVEGQSYGIYNNGRGTVNLYNGSITGGRSGIYSLGGTINISRAEGSALTVSGRTGVSATGGAVNLSDGVVEGISYGLATRGTAAATLTGGTVTGGEYDIYCASQRKVTIENTPVFSEVPKFFVANSANQPQSAYLNVLHYTFTDGAGEPVEVTLYTDVSQIIAGNFLINCTQAQAAKINCGNEEMELEYEANGLKMLPVRARIGERKYRTLSAAFADAALPENEGCTLIVTSDVTLSESLQVSAAFTVDINGHTVNSAFDPIITANSGADITITDGVGGGALVNNAGDAVALDGGKVTLLSFAALSGVSVNTSFATAADARLRLVDLSLDQNNRLKITLGADCNREEYFALSDADYSGEMDFTYGGDGSLPYVLAYIRSEGAIKLHTHSWEGEFTVDRSATCTEDGLKSKHCTGCDSTKEQTVIAATGHSWQNATCTLPKHCPSCGSTQGGALGHRWNEATCTQAKYCPVCDTSEGEALGHRFGNWSVKTQPTEESEGEAEHTCSRCREKHSEVLPALTSESYTKTEVGATLNANAYTQYSLEIGGKTVTFRVYKEGTKLTLPQTEGGNGEKNTGAKTATIAAVVCVAVFAVAVGAVVLYINGAFDKKRRRR